MRNPNAKTDILKTIYAFRRLTYYQLTKKREIMGSKELRLIAKHMDELLEKGLVKRCNSQTSSIHKEKYRHTYLELTKAGARQIGVEGYRCADDFSTQYPSYQHQYGLRTAMVSVYYAYRDSCQAALLPR